MKNWTCLTLATAFLAFQTLTIPVMSHETDDPDHEPPGHEEPPVTQDCDEFITGGGWILDQDGNKINFGIVAGQRRGELFGNVTIVDHARKIQVRANNLRTYQVQHHEHSYRFLVFDSPRARNTGQNSLQEVRIQLVDVAEPGSDDIMEIQFHNGGIWHHVRTTLGGDNRPRGGGNLQLHVFRCEEVDELLGGE